MTIAVFLRLENLSILLQVFLTHRSVQTLQSFRNYTLYNFSQLLYFDEILKNLEDLFLSISHSFF